VSLVSRRESVSTDSRKCWRRGVSSHPSHEAPASDRGLLFRCRSHCHLVRSSSSRFPFPSLQTHSPISTSSIVELGLGIMVLSAVAYRPLCPKFYGDSGTIRLTTPVPVLTHSEKSPVLADPYHPHGATSGVQLSPRKTVPVFRATVSENGRESPSRPIPFPLFSHIMASEGMVPIQELGLNLRGTE
jgi:hypothetical protein